MSLYILIAFHIYNLLYILYIYIFFFSIYIYIYIVSFLHVKTLLAQDAGLGRCKATIWCANEGAYETSKSLRWVLLLQQASAEIATCICKMVVCQTGTFQRVKCVRIEGGMGLCMVELRYISGIQPALESLGAPCDVIAEPWGGTRKAGIQWVNLQSKRSFDGHHCVLDIGRSIEANGMPKTSGVAYVAKNTNNPWRVFVPGMEALVFMLLQVKEAVATYEEAMGRVEVRFASC